MFEIVSNWHDVDDNGYAELAKVTLPTIHEYAARHGYRTKAYSHPGHFGKIRAILDSWSDAEWLWWIDIDAVVTNAKIRLQDLATAGDVILTCDQNGLNSGSMLIRTIPEVRDVFQEIWNRRGSFDFPPWHDQNGLAYLLWTIRERVRIAPKRLINSYPSDWRIGDFVLHWPGQANSERVKLIERHLIRYRSVDVV